MDGFEEKKWFVYLGDHHEGPFSLGEIQGKMSQGQVSASNYVWAEGMADWKLMTEVSAFSSIIDSRGSNTSTQVTDQQAVMAAEPFAAAAVVELRQQEITIDRTALDEPVHRSKEREDELKVRISSSATDSMPQAKPPRTKKFATYGLLLLIAGGALAYVQGYLDPAFQNPAMRAALLTVNDSLQPLLINATEKFPALTRWISPIPTIPDMSPVDYDELRAAASSQLEKEGARLAVGLASSDPLAPSFYVATNLPDGTSVDIYVEGISDTLLGQMSFSSKVTAIASKHLGKSGVVKFPDGRPLPRGRYDVYAIEADQQPDGTKAILAPMQAASGKVPAGVPKGSKLLAQKNYFLGGPNDANYTGRLKKFHEELRNKANSELAELKQFATMLESQLAEGIQKFKLVYSNNRKAKVSPASKRAWVEYSEKYEQLAKQINEASAKWTPEALQGYFYDSLYSKLIQTYHSFDEVHKLQAAYFAGTADRGAFDIQIGQVVSGASTAIVNFKSDIERAEKIPPSPNGMPRREGL